MISLRFLDVPSADPDDARRRRLLNILLVGVGMLSRPQGKAVTAALQIDFDVLREVDAHETEAIGVDRAVEGHEDADIVVPPGQLARKGRRDVGETAGLGVRGDLAGRVADL